MLWLRDGGVGGEGETAATAREREGEARSDLLGLGFAGSGSREGNGDCRARGGGVVGRVQGGSAADPFWFVRSEYVDGSNGSYGVIRGESCPAI
jgi:hypothetical protein